MLMDIYSEDVDVIKKEFIVQLLPDTWNILTAMLAEDLSVFQESGFEKEDLELDYLASVYHWPDNFEGELSDERVEAYQNTLEQLFKEFSEATKQGESVLELGLGDHDRDECGSSYDGVNGGFFALRNAWQLTPAAAALPELTFVRETFIVRP